MRSKHIVEWLQTWLKGGEWMQRDCCKLITKDDKRMPDLRNGRDQGRWCCHLELKNALYLAGKKTHQMPTK